MIGLLPMGGKAERWNGHYKEFLPVGHNKWLCDYAIDAFREAGVHRIRVVSNVDKIAFHAQHFAKEKYKDLDIELVVQRRHELWGAIRDGIGLINERILFAMPDTMIPRDSFTIQTHELKEPALRIGMFETQVPENFSVLSGGFIRTKDSNLRGTTQYAWGVLSWSPGVSEIWRRVEFDHYDRAIEFINKSTYTVMYRLPHYQDVGSWSVYQELIKHDLFI